MNGFIKLVLILLSVSFCLYSYASVMPNWNEGARIPREGRENILGLPKLEQKEFIQKGYIHTLKYPVEVTGVWLPYEPFRSFVEADADSPLRRFFQRMGQGTLGIQSEEDFYQWVGLNPYPEIGDLGSSQIPYPEREKPDYYMGASIHHRQKDGAVLTFSCTTCHSAQLFGQSIMGLTNKRSRANELFVTAQKALPLLSPRLFKRFAGATKEETEIYARTRQNANSIGAVEPQVLGLDSSLAQVALSLAKRGKDAYATKGPQFYKRPRKNPLETFVADSKPAVWWNVKYKNRWLADGSIVSGNPLHTNILWNELGRGTDMRELQIWMEENSKIIDEMTAAVFSTKPPRYEDFFPLESLDLQGAKRGEKIFNQTCKRCHGVYEKAWSKNGGEGLSERELIQTTKVTYFSKTPIKDVGTDANRYEGMKFFAKDLNRLAISKWMKTKVIPQKGYVPPPLEGIWARYPYLHNNSIPNLCALMTPPHKRPVVFYQGPAENKETDYDRDCVGYPVGEKMPKKWSSEKEARFDSRLKGLSNSGHYDKIFLNSKGKERFTPLEKRDLREFLKTL